MRNSKSILILIIVVLSIVVFTACNTTNIPTDMSPTIKTIYSSSLKELVTAHTITQTQSDKVLEEVKNNMAQGKGCSNGLGSLVKNGIIYKSQADTINQKFQIAMIHIR